MSIFRNFLWDVTPHKALDLVLEAVNEVCKNIVIILGNITVLFYQWLYNILWVSDANQSLEMFPPVDVTYCKTIHVHSKLIRDNYILFL